MLIVFSERWVCVSECVDVSLWFSSILFPGICRKQGDFLLPCEIFLVSLWFTFSHLADRKMEINDCCLFYSQFLQCNFHLRLTRVFCNAPISMNNGFCCDWQFFLEQRRIRLRLIIKRFRIRYLSMIPFCGSTYVYHTTKRLIM